MRQMHCGKLIALNAFVPCCFAGLFVVASFILCKYSTLGSPGPNEGETIEKYQNLACFPLGNS